MVEKIPFHERRIAVVDTETSGLDPNVHALLEVAVIILEPKSLTVVEEFSSLVFPRLGAVLDPEAMKVNGLTLEMLADAPELSVVMAKVGTMLEGCVLAGHNPGFDRDFLKASWAWTGLTPPKLDYHTLDTASMMWGVSRDRKLPGISMKHLIPGLHLDNATVQHRALGDARRSVALLRIAAFDPELYSL